MNEKFSLPMRATSLIMLLFLTQSPAVATQAGSVQTGDANKTMGDRDIHRLEPGKPVERKFAGGVSHSYQISLVLGQYLKASVLQKGIDVVVAVIDPNGKPVMRIDSPNSNQGPEPIHLVAETSGSYIIKIESFESGAAFGVYELQVLELRESINDDRALEEALKLYVESVRLNGQKSYEQAAGLAERALAIRERIRPAELPSLQQHLKLVADTSSNLAALYNNKGEYAKAEPLYLRSIAIREKTLGPEHPDVANSLHGLAGLYDDKGQYAKAEPLYQRAISIFEKARGPEHPGVANFLNSLALHYKTKDEYAKAEPLFQRALAISEKVLGPSHSLVGSIVNNLGLLYDAKGEYVKAEPLYQRAISIFEKTLGPDHPDLAKSLINI